MSIMSSIGSVFDGIAGGLSGIWSYITNNPDAVAFLVVMGIAVASAIFVVISNEAVHSAFYMGLTMVCIAVAYFFLEAEFVAIVQLMVYVGAITVVFAFSIMITRNKIMDGDDDE